MRKARNELRQSRVMVTEARKKTHTKRYIYNVDIKCNDRLAHIMKLIKHLTYCKNMNKISIIFFAKTKDSCGFNINLIKNQIARYLVLVIS